MSAVFGGLAPGVIKAMVTNDPSAVPPGMAAAPAPRTPIVPQPDQVQRQNEMLARGNRQYTLASRGAPAAAGAGAGGTYANKTLSGAG